MTILTSNIVVALLYFLGGYAGMVLAIAPSNASPVWPAAGIGLVAVLLYGRKVIPGLFAGAFLAQFYSFIDYSNSEKIITSIWVAAIIGTGSTAQALLGSRLIEKFVGRNDPLVEDNSIIRFLILGGPISCVLAATIGTTVILFAGVIQIQDYLLTWGTWWVGDTIGVMIFAPMLLILFAQPRVIWRDRIKSVVYPMLILLMLVVVLFEFGKSQDWKRISNEFERQVNLFQATLGDGIQNHVDANIALKAFFDSAQLVTEHEFITFTESLLTKAHSILALEWIPHVPAGERAAFESSWKGGDSILEPGPDNRMVPASKRDVYFPIRFVVPFQDNKRASGYDIGSNAVALEAVQRARDTGNTAVTYPLHLIQDIDREHHTGTVFYSPVYTGRQNWGNLEDRRQYLEGLVASVFRISDEVTKALNTFGEIQLSLRINDGGHVLFSNFPEKERYNPGNVNLEKIVKINVADKIWTFTYTPSKDFFNHQLYWNIWFLLVGSLLFTAFTGAGLLMLVGRTLRTEKLVKQRTHELQQEVKERKQVSNEREKQNSILRAIVSPAPLAGILDLIIRMTESANPELICSILLLDDDGKHIRHGAAPGLPDFYNQAVDGMEIGLGQGSCGTAMYTRKCVIVEDIEHHPYWEKYLDLARRAGVKACWSHPILDTDNQVLGSFAIYYRTAKSPDEADLERIQDLAQLASIAIERKNREKQIQRLAFYDVLTDLPNRRLLLDQLHQQIASASRHNRYGAILFIDLDNFKTLNDSLGHQVGDQLLVKIARRLEKCIREEDTAGRLGGDEFVVLLRDIHPDLEKMSEHVLVLARRIQEELNKPYNLNGYLHHITPSIGITFFSKENNNPDEILKQADTAMYSAKAKGRNTISFYHPDMQRFAHERLELEKDLRAAINEHQFILHYQPLYNSDDRIISAEALLRWQHQVKGTISPAEFIPLAEECGLILLIGEWVMEEVCKQLSIWKELEYISINISPVQLRQPRFVEIVQMVIARFKVDPHRLMLEMTESSMIGDIDNTKSKMEALQKLGIRIAIDDFGTGYSSLVYLKNLPLDQLKIDKGFVRDIATDPNDKTIVETIIAMAQLLNLEVIAEGVETEYQAAFLREKGCDACQGYYFSVPLPVEQFALLLSESQNRNVSRA